MSFFATISHVKYVEEVNAVRLSLRSSEEQVEEFLLPLQDVELLANSNPNNYEKWWGDGCIQGRRDNRNGFLRIQIDFNRRSVYKMPRSSFDLMLSQIRSEISKGDLEGSRLIFSQVRPVVDTSEISNVIDEKIDLESWQNDLLNKIDILIKQRLKEINIVAPVQQVISNNPNKIKVKAGDSVFIPSDLGTKDVSGKINIQSSKSDSSSLEEAAKLLKKQSKRGKK